MKELLSGPMGIIPRLSLHLVQLDGWVGPGVAFATLPQGVKT